MSKKEKKSVDEKRTATGLNAAATAVMPLLRRLFGAKGMMTADLFAFWEQIAGAELAAFSHPEKIVFAAGKKDNGTLFVAVAGGAFALELQHRENFVLEKVNAFFGYRAVSRLKIRQSGNLPLRPKKEIHQPPAKKILVSKEEQNYINQLTERVENDGLRTVLSELGQNVYSQNANRQERQ